MRPSKQARGSIPAAHRGALTEDIPSVLHAAVSQGILLRSVHDDDDARQDANEAVLLYDLDAYDSSLEALHEAFGSGWRHCVAVKANPVLSALRMAVDRGFGLECASLAEVELSVRAGCPPGLIVFDSPCKTRGDLRRALELGVQINCDDMAEVERIAQLLLRGFASSSVVGLRVNPLLGMGQIKALSVSDATSKFGVPLNDENRTAILALFRKYSFLTALHVHVGSQGCSLEMLATGALTIFNLAEEIGDQIKILDIGGGLPTNFGSDETTPTFGEYADVLRRMVPKLFEPDSKYICVTEFGRSLQAKLGWMVSICEMVKENGGRRIAIVHVGSDMFVRTCYCPRDFPLRVQVFSGNGEYGPKKAESLSHNVVGPLCFGGDKICENEHLPRIDQGDYVVVRDAGANCLSLWSRHCSRPSLAVYGYRIADGAVNFQLLRKKETLEQVLSFWE